MNPPLIEALNLTAHAGTPEILIAADIVLGQELHHQKRVIGWKGRGRFRKGDKKAGRMVWESFCLKQAGITAETAGHYFQGGEAVKQRLKVIPRKGVTELLGMMEIQPSLLSAEQRSGMIAEIARLGIMRGDTMGYLRKEYRAGLPPKLDKELADAPANLRESLRMANIQAVIQAEVEQRVKAELEAMGFTNKEQARQLFARDREKTEWNLRIARLALESLRKDKAKSSKS